MSGSPTRASTRSVGAIFFYLLLIAFSAVIVLSALGLRGGAGTVPLLVGIPTLLGGLLMLVRYMLVDPSADAVDEGVPAPVLESLSPSVRAFPSDQEPETPASRRRQFLFAAWIVGFVAMAAATSFYVAVPVAMLVLFVAVRLSPIAIVATIGGVLALLYGLFDLFLRVRL